MYEDTLNLHNLLLPKLKALRDGGSGDTIHKVNTYLTKIEFSKELYLQTKDYKYLLNWKSLLEDAEKWMITLVKGK